MHQSEYVLKDLNNSIKYLSENGMIIIDDILPLNKEEQNKLPQEYFYENNVLKYKNRIGQVMSGKLYMNYF